MDKSILKKYAIQARKKLFKLLEDEDCEFPEKQAKSIFVEFNKSYFMEVNGYLDYKKDNSNHYFAYLKEELVKHNIPDSYWINNVQIIGWLFQYYNLEQKDKVFELLKKNIKISKENIPYATQLFTPEWIVKYMVQNSLGKFWNENRRNSELSLNWEYYLNEAEQDFDTQKELELIRKKIESISLENIKCIDPCMGSGNILCYIFDLLIQLYRELGYTNEEAVEKIIEKNIYGLDIDDNVSDLAKFSLTMKARQYDQDFFSKNIQPKVYSIEESNGINQEYIDFCEDDIELKSEIKKLIDCLKNAKIYGSLIRIPNIDFELIHERLDELKKQQIEDKNNKIQNRILSLLKTAEILSQKYEIVLTNPPYMGGGGMTQELADFLKKEYPTTKADLFSAFLERGLELTNEIGYSCMVTMQNWMFNPSFEKFRKQIINEHTIDNLLHLENMVMDIAFGTSVSVLRKIKIHNYIGTYNYVKYFDVINEKPFEFPVTKNRSAKISSEKFNLIPGSPIAYWVKNELLDIYKKGIIGDKYEAVVGLQTGNNDRFLRYWFEVPFEEIDFKKNKSYIKQWYPHPKGGAFCKWFGNYDYVINWKNNGEEINKYNKSSISIDKYNHNGICWSHTTNGAFSARVFYDYCIPNLENPILFCDGKEQKYLLALLNSKITNYLLNMINSTMHYHIGDLLHLPFLTIDNSGKIEKIADKCIELVKKDWNSYEYSWNFKTHPLCKNIFTSMYKNYEIWEKENSSQRDELIKNEEYLNKVFISLYGLENELTQEIEEKFVTIKKVDRKKAVKSFLSYAVGCIFGRYSIDKKGLVYAGGKWKPNKYKNYKPVSNNIITICQDSYFENDIISLLEKFIVTLYGKDSLEENLNFIAESLSGNGLAREKIRNYFINCFFKDHCKIYRKRPIYWMFDSGTKNAFKCLIYIHRYSPEIINSIEQEYLIPLKNRYGFLIETCSRSVDSLKGVDKAFARKKKKILIEQLKEVNRYTDKVNLYSKSNISLDLNDGIKHNYLIFKDILSAIK